MHLHCTFKDTKLLTIKIVERSKSLKNKVVFWLNQIIKGVEKILQHAKSGIVKYHNIETRDKMRQLSLF